MSLPSSFCDYPASGPLVTLGYVPGDETDDSFFVPGSKLFLKYTGSCTYPSHSVHDVTVENDLEERVDLTFGNCFGLSVEGGSIEPHKSSGILRIYSNCDGTFKVDIKRGDEVFPTDLTLTHLWQEPSKIQLKVSEILRIPKEGSVTFSETQRPSTYIPPYFVCKPRDYQPWPFEDGKSTKRWSEDFPTIPLPEAFSGVVPYVNCYSVKFRNGTNRAIEMSLDAVSQSNERETLHHESVLAKRELNFKITTNSGVLLSFTDSKTKKTYARTFPFHGSNVEVDAKKEIMEETRFHPYSRKGR